MTTISSTNKTPPICQSYEIIAGQILPSFRRTVVCEVCDASLTLKTEDEKSRNWWHNCIDDIFYGMSKLEAGMWLVFSVL